MTILRMTATFGGLDDRVLTLTPGLNILELPNEGGKSTWAAFLRAMFYGVETRKGRENSEKNRFTPWSGKPMKGSMDILWQDKAITLRRFPKGASPFGGFQAVYTGTEEPVPGLTADNVGQTILGFGREVFERTCFIGQGAVAVSPSAELEQRLAALASSGEEDVSFSQTEARLRAWRNALQANRATGSIPRLQAQLDACGAQLQRLSALEDTLRETDSQEAELARRQEDLQATLNGLAAQQERQYRQAYAAAQKNLTDAALSEREDSVLHTFAPSFYLIPYFIALFLALFGLSLGLYLKLWPLSVLFFAGAAALTGYTIVKRRQARRARQAALEKAQAELKALENWEPPQEESKNLQAELDAVTRSLTLLRDRRAQAAGELRALTNSDDLRTKADGFRKDLDAQRKQFDAICTALDALTAANATLQRRFSPAVSALAGEILAKLTANRYDSLTFNRDFQTLAGLRPQTGQTPENSAAADPASASQPLLSQGSQELKSASLLSKGTADQAYLSLRLAICLLSLPPSAPIVLDDALTAFDDTRLALALQVLQDFAENRQVLLFTCQSRESLALAAPSVV